MLDVEKPAQQMPAELRVALFRVVQESLTNIRKHARATKVLVRLRVEDDQVDLTVLDNGVGAESAADGHRAGVRPDRRARARGADRRDGAVGSGAGARLARRRARAAARRDGRVSHSGDVSEAALTAS